MSDMQTSEVRRDYGGGGTELCRYCGAPLNAAYYFRVRCATPYKSVSSLTGPAAPFPLTDADRVKKLAPATWSVFWTYAIVVIAVALISLPFVTRENSAAFYFLATLAVTGTTAVFAVIHWRPLAAQLRTPGFTKWEAWAGVGALAPLLALNYGYHLFMTRVGGLKMPELAAGMSWPTAVLLFCVFPAVSEEIAFRGLVQYWLDISLAPAKALLLGSAMFAALHFSVISFPYLFLVGVLLAVVRRRTGSLYPGMVIHFLHNLVVVMVFTF